MAREININKYRVTMPTKLLHQELRREKNVLTNIQEKNYMLKKNDNIY